MTENVRNQMSLLDSNERAKNFEEVAVGYTKEQAVCEAKRCLNCKNKPCMQGCPVGIDIPSFIEQIKNENFEQAYQIISKSNVLPAITGRVCPQETQCEQRCVRGIKGEPVAIGNLERFVADYHDKHFDKKQESVKDNGIKVAVIGSGPSGLTASGELKKMGYQVTVYEALHVEGGVLTYGIPQFRLPKSIVKKQVDNLKQLGIKFVCNAVAGKSFTIEELFEDGYKAVYIASGAGLPKFMGIKGENLVGVFSANEYLTRVNLMKAYQESSQTPLFRGKNAIVVGGGNVAMDTARCALRAGANVKIVYRRTKNELPARKEEVEHAIQEGIEFLFLTNPVEIIGENGCVSSVKVQKMQLSQPDQSGRARPVAIENSEYEIKADMVIMALGTSPNPIIKNSTPDLQTEKHGCIVADENGKTNIPSVFAGGDAVTGSATVILAMGAGKKGALAIDSYIKELNK